MRVFAKGFNFSQDGPGNRLVYHLQGCNLRCPWCSNPEGLALNCGQAYSIGELVEEAVRSSLMFFEGGGVTLTGGEVTLQLDEVIELFTRLRAQGIHTCVETNGISGRLPELFPVLDLLIMDIKHYDPEVHRSVTGLPNTMTIENIQAAVQMGQQLALRIPLIGGFNASETDAYGFAKLFRELELGQAATVELLPYHEYGKDKYKQLGIPYTMTEDARITPAQLDRFTSVLTQAGCSIIHT